MGNFEYGPTEANYRVGMSSRWLDLLACLSAVLGLAAADDFKTDYEAYNNARFGVYPNNYFKGTNTKSPLLQISTWDKANVLKSASHIYVRHNGAQDTSVQQQASPLILSADDLTAVYVNRSFLVVFNVNV